MLHIAVVGQGYVGLPTTLTIVDSGHTVVGIEYDDTRLELLRRGLPPFSEPGLAASLQQQLVTGRLRFEQSLARVPDVVDCIVIAVPAPTMLNGEIDTTSFRSVLTGVVESANCSDALVIARTTLTPGTSDKLLAEPQFSALRDRYVYSPEFLRQGNALFESMSPDRVVLGARTERALLRARAVLVSPFAVYPTIEVSLMGAELIKHFSNAVLAVNRVLAADLALVCKDFGIDYRRVLDGITTDHRMPPDLLEVRPGIGDSCLAKDLRALQAVSTLQTERRQFFDITLQRSEAQRAHATQSLVNAVRQHPATRPVVLMLGLTYTPGIGDVRDALSRDIYDALADIAVIRCWDPYVSEDDKKAFFPRAQSFDSLDAAFSGSSFSVALVKHPELDGFDWRMAQSNMFDPRLIFDYAEVLDASVAARLKQPVLTWPSL